MEHSINNGNFIPILRKDFEEYMIQNFEVTYLSEVYDIYFKISPIIIEGILEKYNVSTIKYFEKKLNFNFYKEENYENKSNLIKCINNCKKFEILWQDLKNYFYNEKFIKNNFNIEFKKMIFEFSMINEDILFLRDKHPFVCEKIEFKEAYIEILIMHACSEQLNVLQIIRIEEVARQFNIKSKKLLELFTKHIKHKKTDTKILEKIKLLNIKNEYVVLIDIITLDILKLSITNSKLSLKLEKNTNRIYSIRTRLIEIL